MPDSDATTSSPSWKDAWQLPLLGVSGVALLAGLGAVLMSRPKVDVVPRIDAAASMVQQEQYEDAIKVLNTEVWPRVESGELPGSQQRRYHVLIARSIFDAAAQKKIENVQNYENVIRSYLSAEELKERLEPADIERFVKCLLALDRLEEAQRRIESMPSGERPRQLALQRQLVTRLLDRPIPEVVVASEIIAGMLSEPTLAESDRVWAMTRQAELRLLGGSTDSAIRGLLQQLPRLDEGRSLERAELLALLGRGYLDAGEFDEAERWLRRAEEAAEEREPVTSRARMGLAKVAERRSDFSAARDLYRRLLAGAEARRHYRESLVGLAEAHSALGETEESLHAYSRLADDFAASKAAAAVTPAVAAESAMRAFRVRFDAGDTQTALRFATVAQSFFGAETASAEVMLGLGEAHRRLADETIAEVTARPNVTLLDLEPATRLRVREHFLAAAEALRTHAGLVAGRAGPAYADSLWGAADAFDRAGDQDRAVTLFRQYAEEFPGDPRTAEARFRTAKCYQSRGDLDLARAAFEELIASRDSRPGVAGSGPFADASYVPLAQVLLTIGTPDNIERAEQLLIAVVDGTVSGVDSPNFRAALAELGQTYYRSGAYERAIERIEEYLARFPDEPGADLLRFRLADSFRLSAQGIDRMLRDGVTDDERESLTAKRDERYRRAMALFEQARRELEARPEASRTPVENVSLRNATFYVGDCAFALRDFEGAIRAYTTARDHYPKDPASLVAMVQIVNANIEMGDMKAARTANERAKRFYQSLPIEVWDDPTLPMTREDWERWLESGARLAAADQPEHERPE